MSVDMWIVIYVYVPFPCNLFQASHWPSDHMIRSQLLIGLSKLCILDENSEEVHNLHHNLQYPDGLLDGNVEEVHNLQ